MTNAILSDGSYQPSDYEYTTLMNMLHLSVSKHLINEHFTVVWANDFYYDLIGYSKEEYEALYHNECDRYYEDDPEEWNKIAETVIRSLGEGAKSYTLATRMRRKCGDYIWVRIYGSLTDEYIEGFQVGYTVMVNIDDIIRMQKEQWITYDNLPGFVAKYMIDPDLNLTLLDANERFVEFFGEGCWQNDKDTLFQQNMARNRSTIEANRVKILSGEPIQFVARMVNQYGKESYLQVSGACVDYKGSLPVYLAIFIDITNETELRQMQILLENQAMELRSALDAAERANRAKSDFLSRMSHDIRTPMNAIVGMTEIAFSHLREPERMADCLKKISISSKHLLGLINDILDMSAIESGKITPSCASMSLPEFMDNIVSIIQPSINSKRQKLFIRLRGVKHERLYCDALRLRQVLINILSNATKFTPEEGSVTLELSELSPLREDYAMFRFVCEDTGIGMTPEYQEHLFDAFTREHDSRVDKTEGSGLGMAITKKIVEMLGGVIYVDSAPGRGTKFIVELQLQLDGPGPADERFDGLKVIITDDDKMMCEYAVEALNELGVAAKWTGSGEDAVKSVIAAHASNKDYDAVILDWKMPGMDGVQVVREIRSRVGLNIPILIVSAYDWSEIEDEARRAGVNGFISKPLFKSSLRRAIRVFVLGEKDGVKNSTGVAYNDFSGKRVLLAEDNELNREIAVELLSMAGVQVDTSVDGEQCLNKFASSSEGYYDLILMDVQMPKMNGYEATRNIRLLGRGDALTVPIVAMTADAFARDVAAGKEAGMNGHLTKPLDVSLMMHELRHFLSPGQSS